MKSENPKVGDLRVWHIPQVPGKPFHVEVRNLEQAVLLLDALADYDAFQLDNNIKGDYCNAAGLQRYEADNGEGVPGWCDWYDDATGDDVDDFDLESALEYDAAATVSAADEAVYDACRGLVSSGDSAIFVKAVKLYRAHHGCSLAVAVNAMRDLKGIAQ